MTPRRPRIAFYADDFTGATDALEALAAAGLATAVFLDPPTPPQVAALPALDGIGIAGTSRTMTPDEMERRLPDAFRALAATGAPLVHYKVCSTGDSGPGVGSIGKAIDLGRGLFPTPFVPLMVGMPRLGRYCVFGNVFARSGLDSEPYRLDRHPTMRIHPTTPMDEADLRLHLARQTDAPIGLLDVLRLTDESTARRRLDELIAGGSRIVLFDVLTDGHVELLGRLLDACRTAPVPLFVVGSSAVEHGLVAWWRATGLLGPTVGAAPRLRPAGRLVVASGSCSPVTDRQIGRAVDAGFGEVAVDTPALADPATRQAAIAAALDAADAHADAGRSIVFHTARGPRDPRLLRTRSALATLRLDSAAALGAGLGMLLERAVLRSGADRVGLAGGDTSSHAARALGIEAIRFAAPLAPGSPLCLARAPGRGVDGLEIFFKGGQNGRDDFFLTALAGGEAAGGLPPNPSRTSVDSLTPGTREP